jgi:hypothetical protein
MSLIVVSAHVVWLDFDAVREAALGSRGTRK